MKRFYDFVMAFLGLIVVFPVLLVFILAVWFQDFRSPFYIAPRVGRNGRLFNMVKLRSMVVDADKAGVDSTSSNDFRITPVGRMIRRFKIDELSQLWNVLWGDMSFVGPRPNVEREVALYTEEERHLLDVRPGITDPASIVFSDEGEILAGSDDPDLKYNQVIRPWKSRLSLLYVRNGNSWIDLKLILLTVVAVFSRPLALRGLQRVLRMLGADEQLLRVACREDALTPYPPPGADRVVRCRG
ncbi:MAG: sugar transferase [Deltaproteobacteria bacterium]|nr:sugar transferase [Deltaproteobacteria bacterium]